jgi:hypothetical protein
MALVCGAGEDRVRWPSCTASTSDSYSLIKPTPVRVAVHGACVPRVLVENTAAEILVIINGDARAVATRARLRGSAGALDD